MLGFVDAGSQLSSVDLRLPETLKVVLLYRISFKSVQIQPLAFSWEQLGRHQAV